MTRGSRRGAAAGTGALSVSVLPSSITRPFLAGAFTLALGGCASDAPFTWVSNVPVSEATTPKIQPGDQVSVVVRKHADLWGTFPVDTNGYYVQPLVGHIAVGGLTPQQAAERIAEAVKGVAADPEVSVAIATPRPIQVSVLGEVATAGRFEILPDQNVLDVLALAGGLSEFAKTDQIYVIRRRPSITRVRFRYEDLVAGDPRSVQFLLRQGDVIVVE